MPREGVVVSPVPSVATTSVQVPKSILAMPQSSELGSHPEPTILQEAATFEKDPQVVPPSLAR